MSEIVKSIILGVVQGLSEFLPISSSGHLVLFQEFLNFQQSGLAFEIFVHFGTLLAVLVAFRTDIVQMIKYLPGVPSFIMNGFKIREPEDEHRAMSTYIVISMFPAAIVGLFFKDQVSLLFNSLVLVLFALFATGIILWSSKYAEESETHPFLNLWQAILIGCAQAFAIIPGISRSGSTIVTGLWLGVQRDTIAKFSFLMSVPVILGATVMQVRELMDAPPAADEMTNLIVATLAAAVSGYAAIIWMLEVIRRQRLEWFGVYCLAVSILGGVYVFLGS